MSIPGKVILYTVGHEPVIMDPMAHPDDAEETPDQRARLATAIESRRLELGLSARAAATAASIARGTWDSAENGSRRTLKSNYAAIERALKWAPGSIQNILNGGNPTPADPGPITLAATATLSSATSDEAIIRVMNSPDLDDQAKAKIMRLLIAEQERFTRERITRADELIQAFRAD